MVTWQVVGTDPEFTRSERRSAAYEACFKLDREENAGSMLRPRCHSEGRKR
jgi:hypothetical protein